MPYTTTELENVDFYNEFVSKLRTNYLEDLQEFASIGFRRNGVLYSFEDIISSNGIEDVELTNSSLYYNYLTKNQQELTKTLNIHSYPRYIRSNSLEKIVDRNISELLIISRNSKTKASLNSPSVKKVLIGKSAPTIILPHPDNSP